MNIVISDKFYIGYNDRGTKKDPCMLGFATYLPLDDSKQQKTAYEKRKSTVDNWSSGYWSRGVLKKNKHPAETLDNVLLQGFKISREVKRYGWGGGNVVWRIEDPRGFELEIQSGNMAQILAHTTMIKGEIQCKCIWGWTTGKVVLLPEDSEPYKNAVTNTQLKQAATISLKDVNIGDRVVLKNGQKGTYLGSLHYLSFSFTRAIDGYEFLPSKRKTKFIKEGKNIHAIASPKVAKITQRTSKPMTEQEGADIINTCLTGHQERIYGTGGVVCTSPKPIKSYHFDLFPTDRQIEPGIRYASKQFPLFVRETDGQLCRVHDSFNGGRIVLHRIDEDELINLCRYVTKLRDVPASSNQGLFEARRHTYKVYDEFDTTVDMVESSQKFIGAIVFEGGQYPPRIY